MHGRTLRLDIELEKRRSINSPITVSCLKTDRYGGPIWASHHNGRVLVPHQGQLSDDQIRALIERGAVIGGCLDAWLMRPGFTQRMSNPADFGITIATLVEHYDHICQLAGSAPTAPSTPTSTAPTAASNPPPTSTPSPTCKRSGVRSRTGATPKPTSPIISTATHCGSCGGRCRR